MSSINLSTQAEKYLIDAKAEAKKLDNSQVNTLHVAYVMIPLLQNFYYDREQRNAVVLSLRNAHFDLNVAGSSPMLAEPTISNQLTMVLERADVQANRNYRGLLRRKILPEDILFALFDDTTVRKAIMKTGIDSLVIGKRMISKAVEAKREEEKGKTMLSLDNTRSSEEESSKHEKGKKKLRIN